MVVAVWDALDRSPAYASETMLLDRVAGRNAADALRAPFALGNRDQLGALFEGAGAASVDVTTHQGKAQFPSIRTMVEADLRGWLPVVGVVLSERQIGPILVVSRSEHPRVESVTWSDLVCRPWRGPPAPPVGVAGDQAGRSPSAHLTIRQDVGVPRSIMRRFDSATHVDARREGLRDRRRPDETAS